MMFAWLYPRFRQCVRKVLPFMPERPYTHVIRDWSERSPMEALSTMFLCGVTLGVMVPTGTLFTAVLPGIAAGSLIAHFWWSDRRRTRK